MSTFTIVPIYKKSGIRYTAPSMLIEAANHSEATQIANNSALSRFDEWTFHVFPFQQRKKKQCDSKTKNI